MSLGPALIFERNNQLLLALTYLVQLREEGPKEQKGTHFQVSVGAKLVRIHFVP